MNIAVCVPARDTVHTAFAFDLANAIANHVAITDDTVTPLVSQGTMLPSMRTELILSARRENATHLLYIDSDMTFPRDTIARLLEPEVRVIAANCARRRMPTGPTAANYDAKMQRTLVYSLPESTGLEIVDAVGTGLMLIEMNVFEEVGAPWFACPWLVDQKGYMGEDIYFCQLLKQKGIPIFIDHDLSKEVGHIGTWEYKHEHTWAVRELDTAKSQSERLVVI